MVRQLDEMIVTGHFQLKYSILCEKNKKEINIKVFLSVRKSCLKLATVFQGWVVSFCEHIYVGLNIYYVYPLVT